MALRVIEKSNNAVVGTPIGTVESFGGSTAPNGWLSCDGSTISRTTYSDLFGVVGTSFGVGDGSTTFNIPDLRGSSPTGVGTSVGYTQNETIALGTKYNDQGQGHKHSKGNLAIASSGSHTHVTTSGSYFPVYNPHGSQGLTTGAGVRVSDNNSGSAISNASHTHTNANFSGTPGSPVTDASGTPRTGSATKGKQLGVNFIIKY